eukprot:scaffold1678_cov110-Isochrysis_galbana.AAC.4
MPFTMQRCLELHPHPSDLLLDAHEWQQHGVGPPGLHHRLSLRRARRAAPNWAGPGRASGGGPDRTRPHACSAAPAHLLLLLLLRGGQAPELNTPNLEVLARGERRRVPDRVAARLKAGFTRGADEVGVPASGGEDARCLLRRIGVCTRLRPRTPSASSRTRGVVIAAAGWHASAERKEERLPGAKEEHVERGARARAAWEASPPQGTALGLRPRNGAEEAEWRMPLSFGHHQ